MRRALAFGLLGGGMAITLWAALSWHSARSRPPIEVDHVEPGASTPDAYRSVTVTPQAVFILAAGASVPLTDGHCTAVLNGADNRVIGAPHGHCKIYAASTLPMSGPNRIDLAGGENLVDLAPPQVWAGGITPPAYRTAQPVEITGFLAQSDKLHLPTAGAMQERLPPVVGSPGTVIAMSPPPPPVSVTILRPSPGAPVDGRTLDFSRGPYVLDLGVRGDASPAAAASALNADYRVADRRVATTAQPIDEKVGENLVVLAESQDGRTQIYEYADWTILTRDGIARAVPKAPSDSQIEGRIGPAHLRILASLVGVHSSDMTSANFQ